MGWGSLQRPLPRLVALGVVVAALIGALLWTLTWQKADAAAAGRDGGLFAFTSSESAGSMWGWVTFTEPLKPGLDDDVVVKLSVAASNENDLSLVIAGELADAATRCFADGGSVKTATWDELSDSQRSVIRKHLTTRPLTGLVSTHEQDLTTDDDAAETEARAGAYIVVTPALFEDYTVNPTMKGNEPRSYETRRGAFECSFPSSAFWEQSGTGWILTAPDVVSARGSQGGAFDAQPYLYTHRSLTVDLSGQNVTSSSADVSYEQDDLARFGSWWGVWDYAQPSMVSVAELTVVTELKNAELFRQLTFLAIGLLVAIEGALLPAIGRELRTRRPS